jgi:hypothetical protein
MSIERIILADTAVAAVDLSESQYLLVTLNGSDELALATAGQFAFPLQDNPIAGVSGTYGLVGYSKVIYGGTVAAGQPLAANGSAKAVPATETVTPTGGSYTAGTAGQHMVGVALCAGVSGDIGYMLIAQGLV